MKQNRLSTWRCASVASDFRMLISAHKLLSVFFGLVAANLVLFTVAYSFFPRYRFLVTQEDSLVENCSAILYMATFLLGLFKAFLHKKSAPKFLVLSGMGILGFLDELSFGERIFSLSMPTLLGTKIDSIHDLAFVARNLILGYVMTYPKRSLFALGGILGILIFAFLKWRSKIRIFFVANLKNNTFILALIFVLFGLVAVFIDLELIHNEYLFALEELLEMNAALCLFFLCASFRRDVSRSEPI